MNIKKITPAVSASIEKERRRKKTKELFLIFDMGYGALPIRKNLVRHMHRVCRTVDPTSIKAEDIKPLNPTGIIITDGPGSAFDPSAKRPTLDMGIFDLEIPVLGIGLGCEFIALLQHMPAPVRYGEVKYERAMLELVDHQSLLLKGVNMYDQVLERCGMLIQCDNRFVYEIAATDGSSGAAAIESGHLKGVNFDLASAATTCADIILANFLFEICLKFKMPSAARAA